MSKNRTIVLGGARSGKSAFAERLVDKNGKSKVYIATAQAFDDEMRDRINLHVSSRGPGWQTIEAPLDIAAALRQARPDEIVLLDCATLWLSNHLLAENDLGKECDALIGAIMDCAAEVVIVSNEVGFGIVPDTPLGRRFRDAQGTLNQRIAAMADLAVLVVAGLPLALKGALPDTLR